MKNICLSLSLIFFGNVLLAQNLISPDYINDYYHFYKVEENRDELIITYNNENDVDEFISVQRVVINNKSEVVLSGSYFSSSFDNDGDKFYFVEYMSHTDTSSTAQIKVASSVENMLVEEYDSIFQLTFYFGTELDNSSLVRFSAPVGLKYIPVDYFTIKAIAYSDNYIFDLPPTDNPGSFIPGLLFREIIICRKGETGCTRENVLKAYGILCGGAFHDLIYVETREGEVYSSAECGSED